MQVSAMKCLERLLTQLIHAHLIGMILLNGAIEQSKIDILDISDCGITIAIVDHVLKWTNHLKQLDATKNPKFVMKEGGYQHSFTCLVKLDDGTNASNNIKVLHNVSLMLFNHINTIVKQSDTTDSQSSIRPTFGLSFQPMDTLPDTPF